MKPDFICIGAQKAGTSWLYSNLARHPEFTMFPIKELHYFDRDPSYPSPNTLNRIKLKTRLKDLNWLKYGIKDVLRSVRDKDFKQAKWWVNYHFSDHTDSWYHSLFESEQKITGDITPSYSILNEEDVARMHKLAPQAKIIFFLRDPVDRAWSMLRFEKTYNNEDLDIEDFSTFKKLVDSPRQELRSDYLRTIDLFSKYYSSQNILIGFYDAISRDPKRLLGDIYQFLEVEDCSFFLALRGKVNKSKEIDCPPAHLDYLKTKYATAIEMLAQRYGSYAEEWDQKHNGASSDQAESTELPRPTLHP